MLNDTSLLLHELHAHSTAMTKILDQMIFILSQQEPPQQQTPPPPTKITIDIIRREFPQFSQNIALETKIIKKDHPSYNHDQITKEMYWRFKTRAKK